MKKQAVLWIGLTLMTVLSGCAGYSVRPESVGEVENFTDEIMTSSPLFSQISNEMESRILRQSLFELGLYLKNRYGKERFQAFVHLCRNGTDYPKYLRQVYGKNMYQVGVNMFRDLEKNARFAGSEMTNFEVGCFRVHYYPGSQVERDKDMLEYLIRDYFTILSNQFLASAGLTERWEASLNELNDRKIEIVLYETKKQSNLGSVAAASLGFRFDKDGTNLCLVPIVGISTTYYNILSSTVFLHEMTHIVAILSLMDKPLKKMPLAVSAPDTMDGRKLKKYIPMVKKLVKEDIDRVTEASGEFWGEGIAEYMTELYGIYYRYGLMADVDREMRYYKKQGHRMLSVKEMLQKGLRKVLSYEQIIEHYQQAHSVTRHFIRLFGQKKLTELIGLPLTESNFLKVTGMSMTDFEKDWEKTVFQETK